MKFKTALTNVQGAASRAWSRSVCALFLVASGQAFAAGEFTDRVTNAKTMDTKALRDSSKTGADNFGFILGIGGMVVGLFFFFWGILWIMSAGRSEGRKNAGPGWIMLLGGGALGAATALYLLFVGVFSGAAS